MGRRYRTNINQEVVNIMNPYFAEFLGTLVLILMGDGVCACSSLEKSKGKGLMLLKNFAKVTSEGAILAPHTASQHGRGCPCKKAE